MEKGICPANPFFHRPFSISADTTQGAQKTVVFFFKICYDIT